MEFLIFNFLITPMLPMNLFLLTNTFVSSQRPSVTCRVNISPALPMNIYLKKPTHLDFSQISLLLFACYIVTSPSHLHWHQSERRYRQLSINEKSCRMGSTNMKFYHLSGRCFSNFQLPSSAFLG